MTITTTARRAALAAAGAILATVAAAPAASAYHEVIPGTDKAGVAPVVPERTTPIVTDDEAASLAYTGVEVGAFAAAGLGLVGGGALLLRASRRSRVSTTA